MTADKPTSLVPELRFPDFRDAGDWQFKPLGDIAEPISDRVGTTVCVPMSVTTGVGLVSQQDKFGRTIAGESYKNYIRLQRNDFAYNKSSTKEFPQGYIARYSGTKDAAVPNSIFTCFRPNAAAMVPEYLDHLFHGNHHGRWLRKYITVGARAHGALSVSDDALMSMQVPLPPDAVSRREQQKIADCLGSLDDLIAAEHRQLEALRRYQQGLMQELFPQPGETMPRLRFPEFRDAAKWRISPLGAFIEEYREKSTAQDEYEVLTSARIGLIRQRDYYDNDRITSRDNVGFNIIPPEHLTYRSRSDNRRFYFNENDLGITGIISTYYPVFRIKGGSNQFFIGLLSHYADLVGKHSVGTSQTVLSLNELRRIMLPIPEPTEQQKIANCLTLLHGHIEIQARKLDTLKQHKQGLLQQLFPSLLEQ